MTALTIVLWGALFAYGIGMWLIAPASGAAAGFFRGRDRAGREPTIFLIAASITVAWIFSKSVTNAANLGRSFGLLGGLGYAVYYLGIPLCAVLIVRIRRLTGARSLAEYLTGAFGPRACQTFLAIVLVRLFNEVWSNTSVVAAYFGAAATAPYVASALAFTAFALAYALKGGLRASLVTDAIEFWLLAAAVVATVVLVLPAAATGVRDFGPAEPGLWNSGIDFVLVALLQCVAYPFHDPVLTDRAFIAEPGRTLRAYAIAGAATTAIIVLFSTVGIAARGQGDAGVDAPVAAAQAGGAGVLTLMMIVMMLSAGSTLDSTFSATAKAVSVDLGAGAGVGEETGASGRERAGGAVRSGRVAMIAMAVLGNLPMLFGAGLLKATTVSGTMVLGLAPIFLFPTRRRRHPLVFFVPVGISLAVGVVSAFRPEPWGGWRIGAGPYGGLLAWNAAATVACWGAYGVLSVGLRRREDG